MPVLKTPGFSLDRTWKTHQTLSWRRVMSLDGIRHIITCGDMIIVAHQWKKLGETYTMFWGPDTDFFDFWFSYFDLAHDYMHTSRQCKAALGPISRAERTVSGFHLINVPQFQAYIENHIMSHVRSRKNQHLYFQNLCAATCGIRKKRFNGLGVVQWLPFPTPAQILDNEEELEWYLPKKVSRSIVKATRNYIDGVTYELPPLMSDRNRATLRRSYNMDPENVIDWFMDGTDHDMKYVNMLLTMAELYNWTEPEV